MSLPSAQIQSIGKTARANAEAGAPAILDSALLEGLGISAKEQNFGLTGNVESTTTSVLALLDGAGEICRLRTVPQQAFTGFTPGLTTPISWLSKLKVHSVKHFVPSGSGSATQRLGHLVYEALLTARIPGPGSRRS